jgi:hypothetical protein
MDAPPDASLSDDANLRDSRSTEGTFGRLVHLCAAYVACLSVLYYIQSGASGIIDPDGYYHIRWSQLLWENLPHGRLPRFVWLPLTILNPQAYVDHHFLFHVLQIPFTWGPDLVAGAKASAVVYGALAIFSCYCLALWSRCKYPSMWLVALLACSAPYLFRMSLPRAPSVTIVTLVLAIWLLFTKRYLWFGILSFALVWMYSLFPLIGVLAAIWTAAVWFEERRFDWRPIVAAGVGILVGNVVNPYFPTNIALFLDHVGMKVASEYEVSVGNEWYPYETWYLLTSCAIAWVAQLAGWISTKFDRREGSAQVLLLFVFSTFLLVLTMKSRRFVEYWPPFAIVYAAFALKPVFEAYTWADLRTRSQRWIAGAAASVLMMALCVVLYVYVTETRATVSGESDPHVYAGATDWLKANSPAGATVFNTDWDDFPMLFLHDTHNVYVSGLDPTYLLHADPELSKLYIDITLGHTPDPAKLIRDRFGARFAFTDSGHTDFIRNATTDDHMKIVYEDEHAVVLEINDAALATDPEA